MKKAFFIGVLASILAACASSHGREKDKVVYQAPPPPKTYNLDVYPGKNLLFSVKGRDYTYYSLKVLLDSEKLKTKGYYYVLYHDSGNKKDMMKFVCFDILVMDTGVAGYLQEKGGISPARFSVGRGGMSGIAMLHQQCAGL